MENDISLDNEKPTDNKKNKEKESNWSNTADNIEFDFVTDSSQVQSGSSGIDVTENLQSEAVGSASRIIDALINNVHNCVSQNLNSNRPSDLLFDESVISAPSSHTSRVEDECLGTSGSNRKKFNSESSSKTNVIDINEKNSMPVKNKDISKVIPIAKSNLAHLAITAKVYKNPQSLDATTTENSLPSTSNSKKKKRPKRFDNDEENSGVSPPKQFEKYEYKDEDEGVRSFNTQDAEEITTDSDMTEIKDLVNRYEIEENASAVVNVTDEKFNIHVVLLQVNESQERNERTLEEVNVINAVEMASREALFDPNSEVSLLEDFDLSEVTFRNIDLEANDEPIAQDVVVQDINIGHNNEVLDFPMTIHPFPNWLLQMLIAEEGVEELEAHDEPHFYCQGDGLGVHPSFASEDADDDTSSDSSLDVSTNDEAEAEPSESEVEVGSLPFDSNETARQEQASANFAVLENERERTAPSVSSSVVLSIGNSSGAESAEEYFDTVEINEATNNVLPTSNKKP